MWVSQIRILIDLVWIVSSNTPFCSEREFSNDIVDLRCSVLGFRGALLCWGALGIFSLFVLSCPWLLFFFTCSGRSPVCLLITS